MYKLIIFWQLLLVSSLIGSPVWSQTTESYVYLKPASAEAYWTLQAKPTDQTPTVRFYNARHQLLYEESLPIHAKHVDRRAKRALDVLLANLVNNRVLTTAYLTADKPTEWAEPAAWQSLPADGQQLRQVAYKDSSVIFSVDPTIGESDQLTILCAQTQKHLINLVLEDEARNVYFEKCVDAPIYKYVLHLSQMNSGLYYLKVSRQSTVFTYRLSVDQYTQHYTLQRTNEPLANP